MPIRRGYSFAHVSLLERAGGGVLAIIWWGCSNGTYPNFLEIILILKPLIFQFSITTWKYRQETWEARRPRLKCMSIYSGREGTLANELSSTKTSTNNCSDKNR